MRGTDQIEVAIILNLKRAKRYMTATELSSLCEATEPEVEAAIRGLSERGYRIDRIPGEGYRLAGTPEVIDGADLRSDLHGSLLGTEVFAFGRVTSTNDVAVSLARGGSPEGTLVIAEEQARGRGRQGRTWFSPPGCGLWFSIILRPAMSAEASSTISLAAAAGVAEALESGYGIRTRIKWPNDVLVGGRKLCGILTEAEFVNDQAKFVVVGIGINVLTSEESFPAEIAGIATSLAIEARRAGAATAAGISRAGVLSGVIRAVESNYLDLRDHGFGTIREKLLERSALMGRVIRVRMPDGMVEGVAADIDLGGALLLRAENGSTVRLIAGEVTGIS